MSLINPRRIVLARESRGINQSELNERAGLAVSTLSKVERGELGLSPDALSRIAAITGYPLSFFAQPGGPAPDSLAWRQREKVAQKLLTPVNAQVNILRLIVQGLTQDLGIAPPALPIMVLGPDCTPADVARSLRRTWSVPDGPVPNLTAVVEEHGIPVAAFPFGTERIDSRAALTDGRQPLICINSAHTGDRQRFSLAYQLGHLLMHTFSPVSGTQDTGHEANLFAAELLMPEAAMRAAIGDQPITLPLLADMKRRWRVSMIALLYRADDLGYTTENGKRYLIQQFNALKLRRREPVELDVPPESPQLIRSWLAALRRGERHTTATLAARIHLSTEDFIARFA